MRIPAATYRVQFNDDFRFEHAAALVPNLHRLGVSHLYASPIWTARRGSTHGYDVVDPSRLNPALGSCGEFTALVKELRAHDMGMIVDIVPNHMAASPENVWWMDVLENGAASPYASYFGIDWGAVGQSHGEQIFLPILGAPYGTVLEKGELRVAFEQAGFFLYYYDRKLPLAISSWAGILQPPGAGASSIPALQALIQSAEAVSAVTGLDWRAIELRYREKENVRTALWRLYTSGGRVRAHVDDSIKAINGVPGDARSFDRLDDILQQQPYRLAFWRVATEKINYRRFFDVSDLIGMRVEDPEVFRASHKLIFDLVQTGAVDGLRIDHIDGLADPKAYIGALPVDRTYVIAEKILAGEERLPPDWKLNGTTGYDFLGQMNGLFADPQGLDQIGRFYASHTGITFTFADFGYQRKLLIINTLFTGEMEDLGAALASLAEHDRYAKDLSPRDLSRGLKEVTACMPVYRTYTNSQTVSERDIAYLQAACDEARGRCPSVDTLAYDFIRRVLQLRFTRGMTDESRSRWVRFVSRWQQLSGPIMAKGVEDSAFYVYNRLVSLNEVGGNTEPVTPEDMHAFLAQRRRDWPHTMNASSTHDTKRSEDVRARINVLSEIAGEWVRLAARWSRWLAGHRGSVDLNEEYFYFQNLLGAWPLFPDEIGSFRDRLKAYSTKAAREAREHTNWLAPSEPHERDLHGFIDALFQHERFLASFLALQKKTALYGAVNSLSQVLLKATAPGLPDFYRGTIGWDLSLVDPDNRRPVEFPSLTDFDEPARSLLGHWHDGRVKVFLTEKALAFRKSNLDLFRDGEYLPLTASGKRAGHVFGYARRFGGQWALIVVPRFASRLSTVLRFPTGIVAWRDTQIELPEGCPVKWKNVLTGERLRGKESRLPVYKMLEHFPVALLVSK
jgi:(1->4)-alpha-D-glucan 1-alpha-D-glucosylmutase